ncbi:MAG: hypothetical protein H6555_10135 [Lewinellaceae bacterium]|nr:hypothetical protein [Lewinellaceae bacterium]
MAQQQLPITGTDREIAANIVFGILSRKCRGEGICSIRPYRSVNNKENARQVHVFITRKGDQLMFRLSPDDLSRSLYQKISSLSRFTLTEPVALPDWLIRALAWPRHCLPAGSYPVVCGKTNWTIFF